MIKAEVITHEGNPGPNWLDRCKTAITPSALVGVTIVAFAVLTLVYVNRPATSGQADRLPASSRSQQSETRTPLNVEQPVRNTSSVQPSTTGAIQSTGNASNISAPVTANSLGASQTPALNNTRTTNKTDTSNRPATTDPNTVSPRQLTEGVQTTVTQTVESTQRSTRQLVDGLRSFTGL